MIGTTVEETEAVFLANCDMVGLTPRVIEKGSKRSYLTEFSIVTVQDYPLCRDAVGIIMALSDNTSKNSESLKLLLLYIGAYISDHDGSQVGAAVKRVVKNRKPVTFTMDRFTIKISVVKKNAMAFEMKEGGNGNISFNTPTRLFRMAAVKDGKELQPEIQKILL